MPQHHFYVPLRRVIASSICGCSVNNMVSYISVGLNSESLTGNPVIELTTALIAFSENKTGSSSNPTSLKLPPRINL